MQEQERQSWQNECAEVAQQCLDFWPVPQAVFDSFADLVLALGFRALGDLVADRSAKDYADVFAHQHLDRAKTRLK